MASSSPSPRVLLLALQVLALQGLLLPSCSGTVFSYSNAATDWGGLCATGERQSPINIERAQAIVVSGKHLQLSYETVSSYTLTNTGHTINLKPPAGSRQKLFYNKVEYDLLQIHAHAVSEHTFDGMFGAMEFHFVHTKTSNTSLLLVLSVTMSLDPNNRDNPYVADYLTQALAESGSTVTVTSSNKNLYSIATKPSFRRGRNGVSKIFNYEGSLTTPDCDEVVTWLVVDPTDGQTLSTTQLEQFEIFVSNVAGGDPTNDRPPEPLDGRKVKTFKVNI